MVPILRRRVIGETDLEAVAALLASGFPEHSLQWWRHGLEHMRRRASPDGFPRYGRLLEAGGEMVGALLTIHARLPDGKGGAAVRCNLSSWYVKPAFAAHAPSLLPPALRDGAVTYINISPAAHTETIIAAQGFKAFAAGSLATFPSLARCGGGTARVRKFEPADDRWSGLGELMADHAALGCSCLVAEAVDGRHPFVFSPPRRLRRFLPVTHLLYCRDVGLYARFARVLGTALLRRGSVLTLVDGVVRLPGVPARAINMRQRKYVVGPNPPRPGDLAYTELAIFG